MPSPQTPAASEGQPSSPLSRGPNRARRKQRNPRSPTSCEPCRTSKLRCDRQIPCGACTRRDTIQRCKYGRGSERSRVSESNVDHALSAGSHTESGRNASQERAVSHPSNQDEDYTRARWDAMWQRPDQDKKAPASTHTASMPSHMATSPSIEQLVSLLPPAECCDYLMIQYFTFIAPMFHVLHESSFQRSYNVFSRSRQTDELSWLALLFSILSVSVQTLEENDPVLRTVRDSMPSANGTNDLATGLRVHAMACLSADNFMFHFNLETLESLLLLIYGISHDSGVDAAWTLLGLALNMGIALKCNNSYESRDAPSPDTERRRRCWIGILSLHTYQAILFRDVDIKSLLKTLPPQHKADQHRPAEEALATPTPSQPTGTLIMDIKMTLFKLASRICNKDAAESEPSEDSLDALDAEITKEREAWSAQFLQDGEASILDPTSYAHCCMFEMYACQLYIHLHRPFSRARSTSRPSQYRQSSRWKCLTSGAALLDLQRRYLELPRLRHHLWTIFGMNASCTIHGAFALASSLLGGNEDNWDVSSYRRTFDAAVDRIGMLQHRSAIYLKAYPILRHIQTSFSSRENGPCITGDLDFGLSFDNWMDSIQLFDTTSINWEFWDDILIADGG